MPIFDANVGYFKKSLSSILCQTHDNLELIVIVDKSDTPSSDLIFDILLEYKDDHRLRVIRHDVREGLVSSLNEGIVTSEGNYLARADGDDFSFPERLECQLDYLIANDFDLVGSWAYVLTEDGKIGGKLILPTTDLEIRRSILRHNMILHGSVLMKKKAIQRVGSYNPAFYRSEDYELWLRMMSFGFSLGNCPVCLICIRENSNSITRGRTWLGNRLTYFKSKAFACFRYGFLKPMDISYFLVSLPSFMVHPSISLSFKKLLGIYKPVNISETIQPCQNFLDLTE